MTICENSKCNKRISEGIARYSRNAFKGQEFCFECQKLERLNTATTENGRNTALFVNSMIDRNRRFR